VTKDRGTKDAAHGSESGEAAQIEARKAKTARVRARGENPFANDVAAGDVPLSPLADVRAHHAGARNDAGRYDKEKVVAGAARFRVAGRVLFLRSFGAGAFVRLRDRTGELQLYCEERVLGEAFSRLDDLDLGDFVEADGETTATDKGELSLAPTRLRLLTKAHRPLPTKTSFKDVEQRYRQRYVDLVANPQVADVFRARTHVVSALRRWLDDRGFLEVETPTMSQIVGGALARPFETHHNALDLKLFMRIAPELYLKRLVVGGFERVYEIARCYRNEGISTRHNPEFTMLEYYQAYATYDVLMDQTEQMIRSVDAHLAERLPAPHAAWKASRPHDPDPPFPPNPMPPAGPLPTPGSTTGGPPPPPGPTPRSRSGRRRPRPGSATSTGRTSRRACSSASRPASACSPPTSTSPSRSSPSTTAPPTARGACRSS